jgi:hypothetical protein
LRGYLEQDSTERVSLNEAVERLTAMEL